jgi:ketosteroid isomerase-like protein
MSQENVEVSRGIWQFFNDRDWDAWWGVLDEGVEWHARADEPDAGVHRRHPGVERLRDTWIEMFPDIQVELVGESIDLGEQVVTPTHMVGTARTTGIAVREPYTWLFAFRGPKVVRVREFRTNAEALEAVGLSG